MIMFISVNFKLTLLIMMSLLKYSRFHVLMSYVYLIQSTDTPPHSDIV